MDEPEEAGEGQSLQGLQVRSGTWSYSVLITFMSLPSFVLLQAETCRLHYPGPLPSTFQLDLAIGGTDRRAETGV